MSVNGHVRDRVEADPPGARLAPSVLVLLGRLQPNLNGVLVRSNLSWITRERENFPQVKLDALGFHPGELDQNAQRGEYRVGRTNQCQDRPRGRGTPLGHDAIDILHVHGSYGQGLPGGGGQEVAFEAVLACGLAQGVSGRSQEAGNRGDACEQVGQSLVLSPDGYAGGNVPIREHFSSPPFRRQGAAGRPRLQVTLGLVS